MNWLIVFKYVVTGICLVLCIYEFVIIALKTTKDSFQAINEKVFDQLLAPVITLCPGPAWKEAGPFLNEEHFKNSTYSEEEIFHPETLEILRNKSLFNYQQQYASYYGLCFVIQMLSPVKVSDYSFQIVVNSSLDYNYYLHDPNENEWLLMSVYPYEVPINYINQANLPSIGAADIIIQKEVIKKIPGRKGGCKDITLFDFINCWKDKLAESLKNSNVPCKVPALRFTRFNTDHLEYCTTKDDALAIEGLIYNTAIKNHEMSVCGSICTFTKYQNKISLLSKKVLSKEIKKYGNGYFIIWSFYSTLYVNEKVEQYIFDFDSALVAIGGILGLLLGWSVKSMALSMAEFISDYTCQKQKEISKTDQISSQAVTVTDF